MALGDRQVNSRKFAWICEDFTGQTSRSSPLICICVSSEFSIVTQRIYFDKLLVGLSIFVTRADKSSPGNDNKTLRFSTELQFIFCKREMFSSPTRRRLAMCWFKDWLHCYRNYSFYLLRSFTVINEWSNFRKFIFKVILLGSFVEIDRSFY